MNFLEELENNKHSTKDKEKAPRQLWESCYKYFKHFVSIIQKDKDVFALDFNFTFLNLTRKCNVVGPYEISRSHNDKELKLEVKFTTQTLEKIKIKRKDKRSAELLKIRLAKDGLLSIVKNDTPDFFTVELNSTIPSAFNIILINNSNFFIEYKNICSSTNRKIKLPIANINQDYMDQLAKYILGQNPSLYTESISKEDVEKIRKKIKFKNQRQKQIDAVVQASIKQEEELAEMRKANTLKEKSKKYFSSQKDKIKQKSKEYISLKSDQIKSKLWNKFNGNKSK